MGDPEEEEESEEVREAPAGDPMQTEGGDPWRWEGNETSGWTDNDWRRWYDQEQVSPNTPDAPPGWESVPRQGYRGRISTCAAWGGGAAASADRQRGQVLHQYEFPKSLLYHLCKTDVTPIVFPES